ncbi:MAG TPA: hypothetical protein VNL37_08160 [Candidatus Polarisedimenticolia bacterium]|nr:hypothetical protein [Candidatus Polarisedimenticolia bacterium]
MKTRSSWIAATMVFAAALAFGALTAWAPGPAGTVTTNPAIQTHDGPAVEPAVLSQGDAAPCDVAQAVTLGEADGSVETVAICRIAPECAVNSDCDFLCGPGLGWCRHSKCPVRYCDCR